MKYETIQRLLPLAQQSLIDYHLAMATAAAKGAKDRRTDEIWALVSEDGKKAVSEAMRGRK